jgi:predicted ArsR family transcriptional regulator
MLERLLKAVAEGGVHSYSELAKNLGVSEDLLRQMVEDLVRMGYLEPLRETCPSACAECSMGDVCTIGGHGRAWSLTREGRRVAAKIS